MDINKELSYNLLWLLGSLLTYKKIYTAQKPLMGVDGCWCAPWSSKPVRAVKSRLGGFDSHILPPKIMRPIFSDAF